MLGSSLANAASDDEVVYIDNALSANGAIFSIVCRATVAMVVIRIPIDQYPWMGRTIARLIDCSADVACDWKEGDAFNRFAPTVMVVRPVAWRMRARRCAVRAI